MSAFRKLANISDAPIPWIPAAVKRWMEEQPDSSGLGKLERLSLAAVRSGKESPAEILSYVSEMDTPPHFWGDTTLWAKINGLAERSSPLLRIEGPQARLPQWEDGTDLGLFRVVSLC